jgi:hypothetical protein
MELIRSYISTRSLGKWSQRSKFLRVIYERDYSFPTQKSVDMSSYTNKVS